MAGRKKIPTTLKVHAGKRDAAVNVPACPEWLGAIGQVKWQEIIELMMASEKFDVEKLDADCLSMYCEAHDDLHAAMEIVESEGAIATSHTGSLYPHPAVGMKNRAIERIRKFGRELGINPAVRKAQRQKPKGSAKILQMKVKPS